MWTNRIHGLMGELFGGVTIIPSPGRWVGERGVLVDEGQTLLISATTENDFQESESMLLENVEAMAEALDQEAVIVLAFEKSRSTLIFPGPQGGT